MVLCGKSQQADEIRQLGNHGVVDGEYHSVRGAVGGNSRLDAVHAAILGIQLDGLSQRICRRRAIYLRYKDELGPVVVEHDEGSPISVLCVRHQERDALRAHLANRGIASGCYYPKTLADQPALVDARVVGDLPNARSFCAEALALPCHAGLDDAEIDQVLRAMRDFL